MKVKAFLAIALVIVIVLSAFYAVWQAYDKSSSAPVERDVLFQIAAFNTFSLGNYAGYMNYSELKTHGDFGIGTLEGLDGEMIAVDGVFYHIPAEGEPREIAPEEKAPYATVTFFEADYTFNVAELNYTEFKAFCDQKLSSKNAIYAIKVVGFYDYAQTRSPPKQTPPYPILTEAIKNQSVFNLANVSATAAGFWFPSSMDGVDYVGYHLHLITDDRSAGGHLLDCIIKNATVEIDEIHSYNLILP
ncbi:MAG: acetolactate decarboxylase [Candidatus Bathyarchaeota archaeon]|nr:acetolactate decarboxylase [Candidatus Bathyarchaeota archaeon]